MLISQIIFPRKKSFVATSKIYIEEMHILKSGWFLNPLKKLLSKVCVIYMPYWNVFPPNILLGKFFHIYKKSKAFYNKHLYANHLDFIIDILLFYVLYVYSSTHLFIYLPIIFCACHSKLKISVYFIGIFREGGVVWSSCSVATLGLPSFGCQG